LILLRMHEEDNDLEKIVRKSDGTHDLALLQR